MRGVNQAIQEFSFGHQRIEPSQHGERKVSAKAKRNAEARSKLENREFEMRLMALTDYLED